MEMTETHWRVKAEDVMFETPQTGQGAELKLVARVGNATRRSIHVEFRFLFSTIRSDKNFTNPFLLIMLIIK